MNILEFLKKYYFVKKYNSSINKNIEEKNTEEWCNFKIYLNVKNEKIKYNLDGYSCYKALTGTCSLELNEPIQEFIDKEGCCGAFNYCKILAEDFIKVGVLSPIYISKFEEGFCEITDGQHRACICQHLNMDVPAYLSLPKSIASEYYKMKRF